MLHALKIDMGSWAAVRQCLASMDALTTDQGTERLLADVPSSWREVQKSAFLPAMADCLKWESGAAWSPGPRPQVRGAKRSVFKVAVDAEDQQPATKQPRHEAQRQHNDTVVEFEDTLPDSLRPVLGAQPTVIEVAADGDETDDDMPNLVVVDPDLPSFLDFGVPDLVTHGCSEDGKTVCTHPGCAEDDFSLHSLRRGFVPPSYWAYGM